MFKQLPLLLFAFLCLTLASSCNDEECPPDGGNGGDTDEPITGPANPTPYDLMTPSYFPGPLNNPANPLTEEGIQLGRKLFYDPILSRDSSISCSSCHLQELAFTDGSATSFGVRGIAGKRNAMGIMNLTFNPRPLQWGGEHASLEEQAIHPVQEVLEMDEDWDRVEEKLRRHPTYPQEFRAAFGISLTSEITRELATKAIAQFERILITADSKFDRVVYRNEEFFTELEEEGRELFDLEFLTPGETHPGCTHCHNAALFTDNQFHNNGLDSVASLEDFLDLGRGGVNGNIFDNGKFRTTTLRNIALTAPYMHDGRFATLEEVIEHYARGGHPAENKNPNIVGFELTQQKKDALVAFLNTLTDETFITDERFSNPFE